MEHRGNGPQTDETVDVRGLDYGTPEIPSSLALRCQHNRISLVIRFRYLISIFIFTGDNELPGRDIGFRAS